MGRDENVQSGGQNLELLFRLSQLPSAGFSSGFWLETREGNIPREA